MDDGSCKAIKFQFNFALTNATRKPCKRHLNLVLCRSLQNFVSNVVCPRFIRESEPLTLELLNKLRKSGTLFPLLEKLLMVIFLNML